MEVYHVGRRHLSQWIFSVGAAVIGEYFQSRGAGMPVASRGTLNELPAKTPTQSMNETHGGLERVYAGLTRCVGHNKH